MELTATKMAPPFRLVAKYFFAAGCFFVVLCAVFALSWQDIHGFYFQPKLLAITHLATLGWITMTIFGALFQLVPVVLEVPLWSARLAEWQFWIYLTGVLGLVIGFWMFLAGSHMDGSAALILIAGYAFIWNMIQTMRRVKKWDVTGYFLAAGLFYFFFTISLGAMLAVNLGHPFLARSHLDYLKIHAHLGLIGWVLMIIMGVALKLIPMFTISHGYSHRYAWAAFVLINLGLLGIIVDNVFFADETFAPLFTTLLALGILAYILQIAMVLRRRLRKALDVAMKHAVLSFTCLFLVLITGITIAMVPTGPEMHDRMTLLYGFLALFGVISSLILGQMYKIMPFLVWLERYAPLAGTTLVPTMKDLVNLPVARMELLLLSLSIVVVAAGILGAVQPLVGVGGFLLFTASLLFGYNVIYAFRK
ncbi:MAG TPA: hypothetical protein VFH95_12035 [Candidatus Kapabacteria bacterium]|nr:hypothetical protein [Candidatus Kapabacteria bacterium]